MKISDRRREGLTEDWNWKAVRLNYVWTSSESVSLFCSHQIYSRFWWKVQRILSPSGSFPQFFRAFGKLKENERKFSKVHEGMSECTREINYLQTKELKYKVEESYLSFLISPAQVGGFSLFQDNTLRVCFELCERRSLVRNLLTKKEHLNLI